MSFLNKYKKQFEDAKNKYIPDQPKDEKPAGDFHHDVSVRKLLTIARSSSIGKPPKRQYTREFGEFESCRLKRQCTLSFGESDSCRTTWLDGSVGPEQFSMDLP